MKTDTVLILIAIGAAAYFAYRAGIFGPIVAAPVAGMIPIALPSGANPGIPPVTPPSPGMTWQWNGFTWVEVPPGTIAL